jgi:hypothetical protein
MSASSDQEADKEKQPEEHPTELDCPASEESLYESVAPDCDDLRPICQGDVFRDVCMPGFDDDHDLVMLIGHPCSLREGAKLKARLQAVPVRPYERFPLRKWGTLHRKVFSLPGILHEHHAAELSYTGIVTPEQITPDKRIATLSTRGILLLQQRIVWTVAHAIIKLDTFHDFNAPMLAELELLEFWNEALCHESDSKERAATLLDTAEQFEKYLKDTGLRGQLIDSTRRADTRQQIRTEAIRRSAELSDE